MKNHETVEDYKSKQQTRSHSAPVLQKFQSNLLYDENLYESSHSDKKKKPESESSEPEDYFNQKVNVEVGDLSSLSSSESESSIEEYRKSTDPNFEKKAIKQSR